MTTIAYDGSSIAADSLAIFGNVRGSVPFEKLRYYVVERGTEPQERYIVAAAGTAGVAHSMFLRWLATYDPVNDVLLTLTPEDDNSATLIVIRIMGEEGGHEAYHVASNGFPTVITYTPWAIGSGGEFAEGFMAGRLPWASGQGAEGRAAYEAVKAASKHDVYTGGDIVEVDLYANMAPLFENAIHVELED